MDNSTPTVDAPSTPRQRVRRTRIAASVFFGVLTVAMCVLWVRSYWRMDSISRSGASFVMITSNYGQIVLTRLPANVSRQTTPDPLWDFGSWVADPSTEADLWKTSKMGESIGVPHLMIAIVSAAVASLPWLTCRFSLRAMLIATTLIAVVLGLGVWLVR